MIIGHKPVLHALQADLPPVTLLTGPPSVGKWTLATHLADYHGVAPADRYAHRDPLTVDKVRTIIRFVSRAPYGTAGKLVIAHLDHASTNALNALLKTLEEPPSTARFLLTAAGPTLPTVESRCRTYRLGLLRAWELRTILISQGHAPALADKLVKFGDGTVAGTLAALPAADDTARATALTVVRALAIRDPELLDRACKLFDDAAHTWLVRWLREAACQRFWLFEEQEMYGLHQDRNLINTMLLVLSGNPNARSRLAVRAALQPLLRL